MSSYPIKIVQGNWFRLTQSLQKIDWEGETKEVIDYAPENYKEINVFLTSSCVANSRFAKHGMIEVSVDGSSISYENNGTLPIGLYDIAIHIVLDDGKNLYSVQKGIVQIVRTNKEAGIPEGTEFNVDTFNIDTAVFVCVPTKGDDGVGIESITTIPSSVDGGNNEITITLTDGSHKTFYVKNGTKGANGSQGPQGPQGPQGIQGPQGLSGKDGKDGSDGVGIEDVDLNADNSLTFTFTDSTTKTTDAIHISGGGGSGGQDGEDGEGIDNITATDYSGSGVANVVTVTTTKGNIYSFNVYNGAQGQPGSNGTNGTTPEIRNGYWYINNESTGVKAEGSDGNPGTTPTITASAEVSNTSGSPSVSVTKSDTATGSEFHFSFSGLKGESGSSSGGEANVIEEIQLNGTKINPVGKVVNIDLSGYASVSSIPTVPAISTNISTDASSDTKTASPHAVKTYVDSVIPDTSTFVEKSATAGFLKNDGSVDTNTYLTTHQQVSWTATSGQAGYIANKPTIPTIVFIDHTTS